MHFLICVKGNTIVSTCEQEYLLCIYVFGEVVVPHMYYPYMLEKIPYLTLG
jgi:hypothetical protein